MEIVPAVSDIREAIIECARRKVIWLAAPTPKNAGRFVAGALQGAAAATEFEIPSVAVHVLRDDTVEGSVAWLTQTGEMSGYGVLYAAAVAAMGGRSVTLISPTAVRAPRTPEALEAAERYIEESGIEVLRLSDPSPLQRVLGGEFGAVVHPVLDAPGGRSLLHPGELPAKSVADGNAAAVVELIEKAPGDVIAVFDGVQLVYGGAVGAKVAASVALGVVALTGVGRSRCSGGDGHRAAARSSRPGIVRHGERAPKWELLVGGRAQRDRPRCRHHSHPPVDGGPQSDPRPGHGHHVDRDCPRPRVRDHSVSRPLLHILQDRGVGTHADADAGVGAECADSECAQAAGADAAGSDPADGDGVFRRVRQVPTPKPPEPGPMLVPTPVSTPMCADSECAQQMTTPPEPGPMLVPTPVSGPSVPTPNVPKPPEPTQPVLIPPTATGLPPGQQVPTPKPPEPGPMLVPTPVSGPSVPTPNVPKPPEPTQPVLIPPTATGLPPGQQVPTPKPPEPGPMLVPTATPKPQQQTPPLTPMQVPIATPPITQQTPRLVPQTPATKAPLQPPCMAADSHTGG